MLWYYLAYGIGQILIGSGWGDCVRMAEERGAQSKSRVAHLVSGCLLRGSRTFNGE